MPPPVTSASSWEDLLKTFSFNFPNSKTEVLLILHSHFTAQDYSQDHMKKYVKIFWKLKSAMLMQSMPKEN